MGYSDDHLDELIKLSLRAGTALSAQQKKRAWEKVRQAALNQMLYPEVEEVQPTLWESIQQQTVILRNWVYFLLLDDEHYYRAIANRRESYGQWSHGVNMTMVMFSDLRF